MGGEGLGAVGIARPDTGSETVSRQIGQPNGVVGIFCADHRGDGSKSFLVKCGNAGVDVGQNSRFVEESLSRPTAAAEAKRCTLVDAALDLAVEGFEEI